MSVEKKYSRKEFIRYILSGLLFLTGVFTLRKSSKDNFVWQIDPDKCVHCGKCATACVLTPSAVKCVHTYAICGYCDLCSGYFVKDAAKLNTGAENQLCPSGAIKRTFVEDPYFEYTVDESKCIGCSRCVYACSSFGNGSLYLQVRHDQCKNCNQCAIAIVCPSDAFRRVPRNQPYLLKSDTV